MCAYQPSFLPQDAVVVPQRIYKTAGTEFPTPPANQRVIFYDNGTPGISLARAMLGNHRMSGAHEIPRLTESTRVTLRINVSGHAERRFGPRHT